jgi:hypothetical protein
LCDNLILAVLEVLEYVQEQKLEEALDDPSGFAVRMQSVSKYAHLEL